MQLPSCAALWVLVVGCLMATVSRRVHADLYTWPPCLQLLSCAGRQLPASSACPASRLPPSNVFLLPCLQLQDLLRDPSQLSLFVAVLPCLQLQDLLRAPSQLSLEVAVLPCLQMLGVFRG